jgi:hypothetical protein
MRNLQWFALALALLTGYSTARAGLIGATVDVGAYYPTSSSLYEDGGTTTVSGAIEYPQGTFADYNTSWQIDITDNQIIVTNATADGFPFGSATFNGFILTVLSGPTLVSASVDPSSAFSPFDISIVGGNQLLLNFQGVDAPNDVISSVINITSSGSVPEPATWLTVLTCGMGLLGARRLKAQRRKV